MVHIQLSPLLTITAIHFILFYFEKFIFHLLKEMPKAAYKAPQLYLVHSGSAGCSCRQSILHPLWWSIEEHSLGKTPEVIEGIFFHETL